jgi:hypothetical protein
VEVVAHAVEEELVEERGCLVDPRGLCVHLMWC